jgi:hypothetical protein
MISLPGRDVLDAPAGMMHGWLAQFQSKFDVTAIIFRYGREIPQSLDQIDSFESIPFFEQMQERAGLFSTRLAGRC